MNKPDLALIQRLKTSGSGANNRIRAKALAYYDLTIGPERRATLDRMIREAFATDDWSKLKKHMKGWW